MSLRYTGEATMDEPALRDVERWQHRDKIEVRLDNRQVFFLFFGSALCACMLFVLGVIVGKRLESRGRAAAPEIQDPLAVLDRINSVGLGGSGTAAVVKPAEPALTFPKALIATSPAAPIRALPAVTVPSKQVLGAAVPRPLAGSSVPKPATMVAVAKPAAVPRPAAAKPAPAVVSAPVAAAPKPAPVAAVPKAPPAVPAGKLPAASINRAMPAVAAAPQVKASVAATPAKGRFTLQLSSFPDKSEAETYARRFTAQGAFIVASEVPGKGTWYRVRVGSYASSQEAIAAKGAFEKQTNTIAYIAGR